MATKAQVENILLNAKSGQFVVTSCPGSESDLNGYVVNLNHNDIQTVKIENWESGWPYEMDLYKVNYICNKEEEKTIKIKENFTTKVGIQVEKNGEKVELSTDNVTLKDNDITISADSVYNGYVTFPISTGDCGNDKAYTLSCDKGYEVDKLLSSENAVTAGINKKIYVDITEDYLESIGGKKIYPSDITCDFKIDGESAITHAIRPTFNYYTPGTTRANVLWTVIEGVWFN